MKMRMSLFAVLMLAIAVSMPVFAQNQNSLSAVDYFKALRGVITQNLPAKFTGELSGKSIDEKIGNIPRDSYLKANQRAYVQLAYSKKSGIAITVRNVDELYKDLYRDLPKQIFAFDLILSSEKNDSYIKKYDISYQSRDTNLVILRLGIRSAENALIIYVIPGTDRIQRIDYALGKQLVSSTVLVYNDVVSKGKRYIIPSKFITKTIDASGRNRPDVLEVKNILF